MPYGSVSSGGNGSGPMIEYKIANAESDVMFQGDLIVMEAAGSVTQVSTAAEVAVVGVFAGCEYTNSDGQRVWSNKYNTTISRDDTTAFVWGDPFATFVIKIGNGSGADATLTLAAVGISADLDLTTIAGNAQSGMSGILLDNTALAATAQVRIVGLTNNDGANAMQKVSTATYTHAIVQIDPATHFALGVGI